MTEDTEPKGIYFQQNENIVLEIYPDRIVWNRYTPEKQTIVIEDKQLLCLALLDTVMSLTNNTYDYSLLDPGLYGDYKKFLNSNTRKHDLLPTKQMINDDYEDFLHSLEKLK